MLSCSWIPAGAPCEEADQREKKKKGTPKKNIFAFGQTAKLSPKA
jgi:hypothetical protein